MEKKREDIGHLKQRRKYKVSSWIKSKISRIAEGPL